MSHWNWAPRLWNHPDKDAGEVYHHRLLGQALRLIPAMPLSLAGKEDRAKEGKQLFLHLYLFMLQLYPM